MKRAIRFRRAPNPEDVEAHPQPRHPITIEGTGDGQPRREPMLSVVPQAKLAKTVEDAEQTSEIRMVWGDAILAEPAKVAAIIHARRVIDEENATMLEAAINIGRALIDAREVLSPHEFNRGLRDSRRAWRNWSRPNVVKLIAAAEFFDRHRLQGHMNETPQHYTTLYEFSLLDDRQFERAKSHGLFRADVKRADIQAFKERLAAPGGAAAPEGPINPYEAEIDGLTLRLRRLQGEVERVVARRAAVKAQERQWLLERRDKNASAADDDEAATA